MFLCQHLKGNIERNNTPLRDIISVPQHIGVTLWYLATCTEYRTIGYLFGTASCTVCLIIHDTYVDVLLKNTLNFKNDNGCVMLSMV